MAVAMAKWQVFELHFYAVFLEVKGDRVLLEHVFRWLSAALQLPLAPGSQKNWVS